MALVVRADMVPVYVLLNCDEEYEIKTPVMALEKRTSL